MDSPKLACVASEFPCGLGAKNEEGESKIARKMVQVKEREGGGEESFLPSPPSPPSFIFWLSFHFSGGQNWSFFAPKPNENACYAGYTQM